MHPPSDSGALMRDMKRDRRVLSSSIATSVAGALRGRVSGDTLPGSTLPHDRPACARAEGALGVGLVVVAAAVVAAR